jgi:phage FluMu protein Com
MEAKTCRPSDRELRCACGSLMARVVGVGLELKCRRCKRIVVVPLARAAGRWVEVRVA